MILSVQCSGIKYTQNIVQLSPLSISRAFPKTQTETLHLLNSNFPFSVSPQPLVISVLFSAPLNLPILGAQV